MHKSSIYLPDELKRSLSELSARTGRSEADLIRHAIERTVAVADTAAAVPADDVVIGRVRPSLVGVGVGPGDPGLITRRGQATLVAADRVVVITTDARSVGRAEMVARSTAPTAAIQRVPFAIGADRDGRQASLADVGAAILAGTDAGEMVAVAVIGDPMQWTIFADLAELIRTERPGLAIVAEPGITSYQAAAAAAVVPLGRSGSPMVVLDVAADLDRDLDDAERSVVLYKGSTDAAALKEAGRRSGRDDAIVSELTGLPGQRVVPLTATADGPISYLATVIFPARRPAGAQARP